MFQTFAMVATRVAGFGASRVGVGSEQRSAVSALLLASATSTHEWSALSLLAAAGRCKGPDQARGSSSRGPGGQNPEESVAKIQLFSAYSLGV